MDALFSIFTNEQWAVIGSLAGASSLAIMLAAYFLGWFGRFARWVVKLLRPGPPWPLICPDGIKPERIVQGRNTEVRQLHFALDSQTAAAIIPGAIVKGAGGMGKTTLARYYVQQYASHYAGIWWIEADRPDAIVTSLCNLAGRLDATVDTLAGREALAQKALAHIREQPDPWLLIFDNAHSPRALRGWLPEAPHIHILVTTREGGWPEDKFKLLRTGELDFSTETSPAVALLMQEAHRTTDPAGARALAEALGGLPLALVNAGAYLSDAPDITFATYAEDVERAIAQAPPEGGDYPDSVFAAVALSLERLTPEAAQIAHILAFWAPEGLEPGIFKAVSAKDPEHEHRKPISDDLWPILRAEGTVTQAFAELARRSILERRGEGEAAHFAMHRLTGAVISARLEAEGRARWREAAASVLAAAYSNYPDLRETWPLCAALTPHVQALAGHDADSAAADYLYNQAAIYLGQMRQDLPALMLARASLRATKRLHENDPLHRDVGVGYTTLGSRWSNLGRPVIAEKLLARAAEIAEQNPETTDETKALRFGNHGSALAAQGRRAQAGGRLQEAAGWFRRAARRHQQALLLDRRRGDRRKVAIRLNNLGNLREAQGRRAAAIRLHRMKHKIERTVLNADHPQLAAGMHNLAALLLRTPDWRDAEPLLDEALAINEDAFAAYPRHPNRVDTANDLTIAALMRGDRAKAEAIAGRYPDDLDLGKLERDALNCHLQIMTGSGEAGPEALKEALDLMGLTMDDARRILSELTQPPDPT